MFNIPQWHLIYIYIHSYVGKICTGITPTNSRAKWEDYVKAWNYIKIDLDQEMGQEYSTIVQIIVKADRGKAIAWRSVSLRYQTKKTLKVLSVHFVPTCSLQSTFCIQSAVYILY